MRLSNETCELIIRDQKTSKKTGDYICKLRSPIRELLTAWVTRIRPNVVDDSNETKHFVFLNVQSTKPFSQQAFSKYMTKAFKAVTKENINMQIIRRMMAEGNHLTLDSFFETQCSAFLGENTSPSDWTWLATGSTQTFKENVFMYACMHV